MIQITPQTDALLPAALLLLFFGYYVPYLFGAWAQKKKQQ
jgi:hypothetical protein